MKHIGASIPWKVPPQFIKKKVWATNSLVDHERKIPEVIEWYIADQLLEPTERLNEYLNGRVTHWVDEMRTIRDKRRVNWRVLKQINRLLLSAPENLAYEGYHALLDARFWFRWREFETPFVAGNRLT